MTQSHLLRGPLLLGLLALGGCGAAPSRPGSAEARLALEPCRLSGLGVEARCGQLEVWEDRAAETGRKIALEIAVVPAASANPAPDPLFILVGGPGQAATEVGPLIVRALSRVRRERDLVLVDQRGTGSSNRLHCEPPDELSLAERFEEQPLDEQELRRCLAGLDADPRLYTTPIAMDDLDEVRAALGYQRINLWGASYGTRAALVYARRHPEHLRAMVLDGVAPPSMPLSLYFAADGQRALDALLADCRAEPSCAERFPRLEQRLQQLLEQLEQQPAELRLRDPRSAEWESLQLSHDGFAAGLRAALYSSELSRLLPLVVHRAAEGEYEPFVSMVASLSESFGESMSNGMMLSVICAEDLPRFAEEDARREAEDSFLGDLIPRAFREACAVWPHGRVDAAYAEPVSSDVPTLLLSGAFDPVTPPRWAERAAETLPDSRHLVVPGTGHGASSVGCVPELITEFLSNPLPQALDASCLDRLGRAPFFVSFAGPLP